MSTPFEPTDGQSLDEAVRERLLNNADTNVLSDAEKAKLAGIEAGATTDQTGSEIIGAIDGEIGTGWKTGGGGGAVDSVNGEVGVVVLDADDIDDSSTANKFTTAAEISKLAGIEAGATTDQTGTEIVQAIDSELGSTDWQSGGGGSSPSTGAGAPSSTPNAVGEFYIDTANRELYFATATTSSADWKLASNFIWFDAGGNNAAPRPTSNTDVIVFWTNYGSNDPQFSLPDDLLSGPGRGVLSVNTQNGTTYTLALSDAEKVIDMTNAAANEVLIPTNAAVTFDVNTVLIITQRGAGPTSIRSDTGVTLDGTVAHTITLDGPRKSAALRYVGGDEWYADGAFS